MVVAIINTFIIMANLQEVNFDYIKKWEGGLSFHKKDSASKHPVPSTVAYPNPKGVHTSVGVTWMAWSAIYGRSDESIKDFYLMPKDKWVKVYKWYWDLVGAEMIDNQIIAELMADWAWGSGGNACFQLQIFLNNNYAAMLAVDGKIGRKTIAKLNEAIKYESPIEVYQALYNHRVKWIKTIPAFRDFGRGWMARLEDFHQWALKELQCAK